MKILQLIPALVSGGAEQAVVAINAAMVRAGHDSFVASSGGAYAEAIQAAGGVHYTLPLAAKNPAQMAANTLRLRDIIVSQGIDLIHARSRAPAWSGLWAARLTGRRFVTTFHAAYAFKNPIKKFYNSVMARGDKVIAISDFIAGHIREHYHIPAPRLVTIPRGIDLTRFHREKVTPERITALHKAWQIPQGKAVLLLPARLSRLKGHLVLVEALRILSEEIRPYTVMIGADQGHDSYMQELHQVIANAGLKDQVSLAGHCQDMPAAYAGADLVVAPSLVAEGFGRVPVEAQAMGALVIASDLGGFRETIVANDPPEGAARTGWLFPVGDAPALAARMTTALRMSAEDRAAMAQRAAAHAMARSDVRVMVRRTIEVYTEVLGTSILRKPAP